VIHSLLLTNEDKCIRTPAYYAFELAKPHRGRQSVPARVQGSGGALSISASRDERELVFTAVNPLHDVPLTLDCAVTGAKIASASARLLHHPNLNACNTFDKPDTIVPRSHAVQAAAGRIQFELPALGVCTVTARLA
jgi:alpha-N-arabinofuranosidase